MYGQTYGQHIGADQSPRSSPSLLHTPTIVGPSDHYGIHPNQFLSHTKMHNNFHQPTELPSINNHSHVNQTNANSPRVKQSFEEHHSIPQHPSNQAANYSAINNSNNSNSQHETKVCVIVDSRTPVILKIHAPPSQVTLADLKQAVPSINRPNYKYYFKSHDSEFGIVKEEIQDDDSVLPMYKNRIVASVVTSGNDELDSKTRSDMSRSCNMTTSYTTYDDRSSSLMTTDIDTTSYFTDTENETTYSCSNHSESSSSTASQSDATAVHCVTVHVVLTRENFLGLMIYTNTTGGVDEGIYIQEVIENSVLAIDGRIEPHDKLIQINEVSLEELSNDDAIQVLKDAVLKRGALKLVVAKFDALPKPREAIHPIDTAAWVAHAQAITIPNSQIELGGQSANSSPSLGSNAQDTDCIRPISVSHNRLGPGLRLNKNTTDIKDIIQHMVTPEFGLEIKDREWLQITIPKAFIGNQLVNWLKRNVYGFSNNREAKRFASRMLKEGYIKDPISKKSFSSKSYYTFVI